MGSFLIVIIQLCPKLGTEGPQWGPVELICPSVRLSVSLSVSLSLCLSVWYSASLFGDHKSASHNFVQRMRPQTTGSNPLSGRYNMSFHLSVQYSTGLLRFLYFYYFPVCGSSFTVHLSSIKNGVVGHLQKIEYLYAFPPNWGPVEIICLSVSLSVSLSGRPRHFLVIIKSGPIIVHSAYSRSPRVRIP